MSAEFETCRNGSSVVLSPNSCLCAAIFNGIHIHIWNHYHDDTTSSAAVGSPARRVAEASATSGTSTLISTFKTLDSVDQLVWSPDSALVAVLERHRHVIEIFQAYGGPPSAGEGGGAIARVDTGLNGASFVAWHPSSRALYWFGLAGAFLVSLVDGDVMRFVQESPDGVKLVQTVPDHTRPPNVLVALRPASSASTDVEDGVVHGGSRLGFNQHNAQLNNKSTEDDLLRFAPRTPLMQHSTCNRWIFVVTPRTQTALLSEQDTAASEQRALISTALVNQVHDSAMAANTPSPRQQQPQPTLAPNTDAIQEHLCIIDSSTFCTRLSIPVAPCILRSITHMVPLLGGHVLLSDAVSQEACILHVGADAAHVHVLHRWVDVQRASASSGRNTVAVLRNGYLHLDCVLFVEGKYRRMQPISLALTSGRLVAEVCAALTEEQFKDDRPPLANEVRGSGSSSSGLGYAKAATTTTSRYAPMTSSDAVFSSDIRSVAHSLRVTGLDAYAGVVAISDDGLYVALSPPWDLHLVLIVHVMRRCIHSVLRHIDPVTALVFSHASGRNGGHVVHLGAVEAASAGHRPTASATHTHNSDRTNTTGKRQQLCITTDNHRGCVFLWMEDTASILTIPLDEVLRGCGRKLTSTMNQASSLSKTLSGDRRVMAVSSSTAAHQTLPFHCTSAQWSTGGDTLTLADELHGVFTTATMRY